MLVNSFDLHKRMTLIEMKEYIESIRNGVRENREELHLLQLKRGLYKKYRDEFIPFYEYGKAKYSQDTTLEYQLIEGNQNYDAEIVNRNVLFERIEITFPQDGERNFSDAIALNANGITDIRVFGDETLEMYLDLIKRVARRKSQNSYLGTMLIIYIDNFFELDTTDEIDMNKLELTFTEIRTFTYRAEKVYCLLKTHSSEEQFKIFEIK